MPTVGTEILSYKPSAEIGLGSNASIPAIYSDNNVINQTNRDLMMMNHEDNVLKYKQKIADRDKELAALDSGQVETGNILDQDRPEIDKRQKAADKSFFDMVSAGGINNKEAYRQYQGKIKELKDATTWAQYRFLGRKKLEGEKASQTLDEDVKAYDDHLQNQDKLGFYQGDYAPFQKSLTYDAELPSEIGWDGILGSPTTNKEVVKTAPNGQQTVTETKTTAPQKGTKGVSGTPQIIGADTSTATVTRNGKTYNVTQSQIDFDKIKQNEITAYADPKGKGFQQLKMHRDIYETAPDEVFEPYMNHIIQRAGDYNKDKGLSKGDKGFIDTEKLAKDLGIDPLTGKRTGQRINMSTPDFASYTALADYNGSYAPKSESFNKDESEFDLKKGLNDANILYKHLMGNAATKKANAYANHLAAKTKNLSPDQQDSVIGDLYNRNIISQDKLVVPSGGKSATISNISAQNSLPVFTFDGEKPKQLKPIGATDITDNAGHVIGYKGGYYKQEYRFNGKPLSAGQINDQYLDFKKTAGSSWKGSFDDYLKEAIKNDIYDVKLTGENGSTDKKLTIAAQRAISNKATKKDQEGVFDEAPTDEQTQQ